MRSSTFGSRALRFYTGLVPPDTPDGIDIMNPYVDPRVRRHVREFLGTYYGDDGERVLVLGINPGRFGAGITGITFTDPVALADCCGIDNDWPRRRELSSIFIYRFLERFGGPDACYRRFFLTAVCPLGFVRGGKNLNYYDVPALRRTVTPFVTAAIRRQIDLGGRRDHAIVLGIGANLEFVRRLNEEHGFFATIHGLEHPRFIMQYRRRRLDEYLAKYEAVFSATA